MREDKGSGNTREYRFADCRVDLSRRELWRGEQTIAIEPKAFDLLVYLIRHRDRAVDKNELQDAIWTGTIVTEAALTRCVMKARRAIGGGPRSDEAIRTVRGHGYRFCADVEERRSARQGGPRSGLPLPDKPSVAVLPFVNLSDDASQEYFSDGITEDIITELSRFRSLFVISRHSSFSFKGQSRNAQEIASELGVRYIVDGSIQRSGDRVRINVRLVDAGTGAQLWAERFDREIEDILVLQDEVAATVAATITGRVEASRGRRRIDRAGLESYDYVLRAQALYYLVEREAYDESLALLEKAVEIDPDNARALILLAAVHSMGSWSFWAEDNEAARRLSLELGQRSIELDDTDSLAHALFAEILFDCGRQELADFHFRRALSLNPNDIAARALYASKLAAVGRADEGIEHLEVAERLDPFGLHWIPWIKGTVMFTARRYDEAIEALMTMSRPPNEARFVLAAALAMSGRADEAGAHLERFRDRAREEMAAYPGDALAGWEPIFRRMIDYKDERDLAHLMDALRAAGWD